MPSAKKIKYYSSLRLKKYRTREKKFLAEGKRLVEELLESSLEVEAVFVTNDFSVKHSDFIEKARQLSREFYEISTKELKKLSETENPQGIVAVGISPLEYKIMPNGVVAALDDISEPGNLGTILRTCDWFGIENILLSPKTVEPFNPKVMRASMGAVFHLNIVQTDLTSELQKLKQEGFTIFATSLHGANVFEMKAFPEKSVLIFPNEAHGISETLSSVADEFLTIPKFGKIESLNVSAAAAIILSLIKKIHYSE